MKIVLVLILLLDVCPSEGLQMLTTEMNGQIRLSLLFPSAFNSYAKFCCKVYYGECYIALNNRGYVCESLSRRVTIQEFDGRIDFMIQSAQQVDTGFYRCSVLGASYSIYRDFNIEIRDTSGRQSRLPIRSTIKPSIPTSSIPLVLSKGHTDKASWGVSLIAVLLSILALIIISATVVTLVHRKVKAKNKNSGGTSHDSSDHKIDGTPQDLSSIVYATVDFKDPSALYANFSRHGPSSPQGPDPDPDWTRQHGEVVYSTLANSR